MYQVETTQEIYVVVDASRSSGKIVGELNSLENYLISSLILGQVAENQGDLFGLLAHDDQVRKFIRAKGGKNHYTVCREAIYALQPKTKSVDFNALFTFLKTRLRRRSLVVFLTDLSNATVAESFLDHIHLISGHHLCMVSMIKDKMVNPLFEGEKVSDSNEIYSHLAGHMNWTGLLDVQRKLTRNGVGFNMVNEDQLSSQLINNYLDIKRRQLI